MWDLEFDREKLLERISQSKKLPKYIEGRKLKESILDSLTIERNFNVLTIIKKET